MLGIEDKWVALAYLSCITASLLCVGYGWLRWNRGDETVEEADRRWANHEIEENEES